MCAPINDFGVKLGHGNAQKHHVWYFTSQNVRCDNLPAKNNLVIVVCQNFNMDSTSFPYNIMISLRWVALLSLAEAAHNVHLPCGLAVYCYVLSMYIVSYWLIITPSYMLWFWALYAAAAAATLLCSSLSISTMCGVMNSFLVCLWWVAGWWFV